MPISPTPSPMPDLRAETPVDASAVELLLDHAFGPGRFTKVSERVREFAKFRGDLSFCAWTDATLVGIVRMSEVRVGGAPAIFLGPLAVHADQRSSGLGGQLVERACTAAAAVGFPVTLLVGDEPYFAKFGFSARPTGSVIMPGPVDPRRVLARGTTEPLNGPVTA